MDMFISLYEAAWALIVADLGISIPESQCRNLNLGISVPESQSQNVRREVEFRGSFSCNRIDRLELVGDRSHIFIM